MPPPKGGTQCPHCKQILGAGPTKQFAEFVESFIPGGAVPEAERKALGSGLHYRMAESCSLPITAAGASLQSNSAREATVAQSGKLCSWFYWLTAQ